MGTHKIGNRLVEIYWDSDGRCNTRDIGVAYHPKTPKTPETPKTYKNTRTRAQRRAAKRARRARKSPQQGEPK